MEKNKLKKSPHSVGNTHNSPTHNYIVYKGVEPVAQQPFLFHKGRACARNFTEEMNNGKREQQHT